MSRAVLVNVRRKNGEATVLWIGLDVPVADLNGHWQGPIPSIYSMTHSAKTRFDPQLMGR